jgi:putative transposase
LYPDSLKVIENTLFDTVRDKNIHLFGYVIMPSHIHLLAGAKSGGPGISTFMHSLKGRVRINLKRSGGLWQERFDDLVINSDKQFKIKLEYIHYNPVRDNLVKDPGNWPYSSFLDWKNRDHTRGIKFDFGNFF